MYTHIVLFRLKDPTDAPRVATRLRAMKEVLPMIRELEVGVDDRPSDRSAHVSLIVRYDSAADLDAYAVHPAHQEVLDFMGPLVQHAKKTDYAS
jgi:hypothetical protein